MPSKKIKQLLVDWRIQNSHINSINRLVLAISFSTVNGRSMYLNEIKKYNIIHRLKIIRGHLRKVITMVESDEPCLKIIHQTRSVRFSLKKVDQILIEGYLTYSLGDEIKSNGLQEEILKTITMYNKIEG